MSRLASGPYARRTLAISGAETCVQQMAEPRGAISRLAGLINYGSHLFASTRVKVKVQGVQMLVSPSVLAAPT